MNLRRSFLLLLCGLLAHVLWGQTRSTSLFRWDKAHLRWGGQVNVGRVLHMDEYDRVWMTNNRAGTVAFQLQTQTLPTDSDAYAAAYNYPQFNLGIKWSNYHRVLQHKMAPYHWGLLTPVPYTSRAGHLLTLYASFQRTLWRHHKCSFDYLLGTGIGYAFTPYRAHNNVDNELIGAHFNIFFTTQLLFNWQFLPPWTLSTGIGFDHHSNGATARPNRGANFLSPVLQLTYTPQPTPLPSHRPSTPLPRPHRLHPSLAIGIGGKTLLEEWQRYQYRVPPTDPHYRSQHYTFHPTFSLEANLMYRYALKWASGIGIDLNYAEAAHQIADIERIENKQSTIHPWSAGIALRHETYYQHFAVAVSLGTYLYRKMGTTADWEEKPYYEKVGVRYYLQAQKKWFLGAEVKAHATKADFTQLVLGYQW